ncbi:TolC family protein [Dialister pneumosintes]|uniref:Transporter n=1 Tax=Dialister pneumosintes TaxID=39950 RepID=A0A1B3WDQ5_9FIRM|nr:TolC family protein [Dialister pneumosintes]AOH39101.1 transporter [Dialister pneumosintes]
MNKKMYAILASYIILTVSMGEQALAFETDKIPTSTNVQVTNDILKKQEKLPVYNRVLNENNMLLQKNLSVEEQSFIFNKDKEVLNINLHDAVATAINNNRDIRLSAYKLEKAEAAIGEASASKNPTISYSFNGGRSKVKNQVSLLSTAYSNGVNVVWPLWTGGAAEGAIDTARYTRDIAHVALYEKEADIKLSATTAYYKYLQAVNLSDVAEESVRNLSGHFTNVQQQYAAGIVAKLDVLSSNVSLANAKEKEIAAKNGKDVAEANLNNIMRLPMNTQLITTDKHFPEPEIDITLEQAIGMAQKYRWELIQAEYNVKIAEERISIAKAGYMPTVSLSGGYTWNDKDFPGFKNQGWTIGGGVSWHLFDGGATNSKIKEAKADLKIAEEFLLKARESIELEVRQNYLNVFAAKEQIRATEAAVQQAEEAYKIATVRYTSGVGINLDVLDAQLLLNQARTNYITALYDYNIGIATLEKAMGIPAVIHTK